MKQCVFSGVATALVTPMTKDGFINYQMLEKLIDFQIDNKVDALVLCATTGEGATLAESEHHDVLRHAVLHSKKRIKIIAGVGSNDTEQAKRLTLQAKECGVDALLCVTPYYNKTTQTGLVRHYNAIADLTDLPLILYNVPSRTGMNISPTTYKQLSHHQNIVAVKEANPDVSQVEKTIQLCGDDLAVYSGNDDLTLPFLSLGAKGVVSVVSNLFPFEMGELCRSFFKGDLNKSREYTFKLLPIIEVLFSELNPIPIKHALSILGFDCGRCRMPLCEPSEATIKRLETLLNANKPSPI